MCYLNPQEEHSLRYLSQPAISIIIPTRNESACLSHTLRTLADHAGDSVPQIIVADGGSDDGTPDLAASQGAIVVRCEPGRGQQMNAGAALATGDILFFLHADTLVPQGYIAAIIDALSKPGTVGGAFRLKIGSPAKAFRLIEAAVNLRSRWLHLPYGDQGLFISAKTFKDMGGFVDLPIMEDYELVRRLRRVGRVSILPRSVITSPRRWCGEGVWRSTLTNLICIMAYHLGVSPREIAAWRESRWRRGSSFKEGTRHHADRDHGCRWTDRSGVESISEK